MKKKDTKNGWLAVKVDLEKAFDRLNWNFIDDTLQRVGFNNTWRRAIMACVTTPTFQILWNGAPTDTFSSSRGIRQGDPISPYLFTLCMERLNHLIVDAVNEGSWMPIHLRRGGTPISHLFFADDLMLFGQATQSQVEGMMDCLNKFCKASGQLMNPTKTKICFFRRVNGPRAIELSSLMGVSLTCDLGKYLGIPLIHRRVTNGTFANILDKASRKLAGWKRGCLNLAGRTTLIRSVLSALPSYYMQVMLLPKNIINGLEKNCRRFLWGDTERGKKIHLVAWDQVTRERTDGGLGIKNLRAQNEAFIMKLCWKLLVKKDTLWVKILREKYGCGNNFRPKVSRKQNDSLIWRSICAMWDKFSSGLGIAIGNGDSASFWCDNWSELGRQLIDLRPDCEEPFSSDGKVKDFASENGGWDIPKLATVLPSDVISIITRAHPPLAERGEDRFYWRPANDGVFTVKSAYHFILAGTYREDTNFWKRLWKWDGPEKIKSLFWLFAHDRVHTGSLRQQRGIAGNAQCPFGCGQVEDSLHLFRDCRYVREKWSAVVCPTKWSSFVSLAGRDWIEWNLKKEAGKQFTKKISWSKLFGYMCWEIWTDRCRKLFGEENTGTNTNPLTSFFKACWDANCATNFNFYSYQRHRMDTNLVNRR